MSGNPDAKQDLTNVDGPSAPPRLNGELVFEAPWERRVFGLTMALVERGAFEYAEFQKHLITKIAAWEASHPHDEQWSYYRCWSRALESLLAERGAVSSSEIEDRVEVFEQRPHGHDHS